MDTVCVTPSVIKPINRQQRSRVVEETYTYIDLASNLFNKKFSSIPVGFNLSGYSAGVYRLSGRLREIRYNPYIFAKYFEENLEATVPHEVAHYVVDLLYGMRNVRPHGVEWQQVMAAFGCEASRTCQFDLSGIPVRRQRRFTYKCNCSTHQISARRHNNIHRGKARYACTKCNSYLMYTLVS